MKLLARIGIFLVLFFIIIGIGITLELFLRGEFSEHMHWETTYVIAGIIGFCFSVGGEVTIKY